MQLTILSSRQKKNQELQLFSFCNIPDEVSSSIAILQMQGLRSNTFK